MTGDSPALVILAAGASSRMGQCKALIEFGQKSALLRLLEAGHHPAGGPALVLTGADHELIVAHLGSDVEVLFNDAWEDGRGSSLRVAQAARPGRDLLLAPVDHPIVPRGTFADLRRAWSVAGAPQHGWLAPRVDHPDGNVEYGHPIVVGRDLIAHAAGFSGRDSLRELRQRAQPLLSTPAGIQVLVNVDSPADVERARHLEMLSD